MKTIIARELRRDLAKVVKRVRLGQRFMVFYRSRVVFEIVPPGERVEVKRDVEVDALFDSLPVGSSAEGLG